MILKWSENYLQKQCFQISVKMTHPYPGHGIYISHQLSYAGLKVAGAFPVFHSWSLSSSLIPNVSYLLNKQETNKTML